MSMLRTLILILLFGSTSNSYADNSPTIHSLAAKNKAIRTKQSKLKQRQQYLILELVRSTRSRFHAISTLTKSMSKETRQAFKNMASSHRVDLRKPVKLTVHKDLSIELGEKKLPFRWDQSVKAYRFQNFTLAYNKNMSVRDNYEVVAKTLKNTSAFWHELLIPKAYAQNLEQIIFDLNYLLYIRSVSDEQQLINELGSDYIFKAEEKMARLVQNNKFLKMECNFSAHFMEARIVLGDGSPENQVTLVAGDYGRGRIESSIERNGKIEKLQNLSNRAAPLLKQQIFNEVCINMSRPELEQYSSDLWYFGGQDSSQ